MQWKPRTHGPLARLEASGLRQRCALWAQHDLLWTRRLHRAANHRSLVLLLALVSRLGNGVLWYAGMALLPLLGGSRGWACSLRMMALGLLNLTLYLLLKRWAGRPRPFVACADIRACTRALDQFSFPSGHTLHAVAFSVVLLQYYPLLAVVLVPFTLLIALSRVVLGLHYPSDVLAGAVIGALMAAGVLRLF
ncbi:phosphatase PAP2 family protein [Aquabacterium sp. A7-Y]|uniref:phosphatase PAP2 family protein n=1 Tax=Aquabacterium sp. A7-Y TaxID=1349605 RepID=UPI00223D931B|nr:phosphatase PAP2 family protein [Aquabacterium sp. A7-Y]MCW7536324.1 phosphatase PAP2 family protein [Aquabacterium sp. A7-Y]